MEDVQYNNLIINHKLEKLANINKIDDLINYKYLNLYLVEYLLSEGIHTKVMDSRAVYSLAWIKFYLKYNITKPLLKCYLMPLLETVNGKILLDLLLDKLDYDEKLALYNNFKYNSYWELHDCEKIVINLYAKHGIDLGQTFIDYPTISNTTVSNSKRSKELIDEFCNVFNDTDSYTLSIYLLEFKRRLLIDKKRARDDIKKLIKYKRKKKDFKLKLSNDTEGEYDSELHSITISPKRYGVMTHELSHLMYDKFDKQDPDILKEYEKIQNNICKKEVIDKITKYLIVFHNRFNSMKTYFEQLYYCQIKKKYGSFNKYIKVIYNDICQNNPEMIAVESSGIYFYPNSDNLLNLVTELLIIEKNEFIDISTRNYYSEELMLENLLDALLNGDIYEGKLNIQCLSGHEGIDFIEYEERSFDECLADYDTIKNSRKYERLINDLKMLVGDELIIFLDSYIAKNRGIKRGI